MKVFLEILVLIAIIIGSIPLAYMYGPDMYKPPIKKLLKFVKSDFITEKVLNEDPEDSKPQDQIMISDQTFFIWKDIEGNEHYVSSMKDIPPQFRDSAIRLDTKTMNSNLKLLSQEEEGVLLNEMQDSPQPEQLKHAQFEINIYSYKNDKKIKEATDYFDMYRMPYTIFDVVEDPKNAINLKLKMGLDLSKKYAINFPVIEINGEIIEQIVLEKDEEGKVKKTELDRAKINTMFGLRSTFE